MAAASIRRARWQRAAVALGALAIVARLVVADAFAAGAGTIATAPEAGNAKPAATTAHAHRPSGAGSSPGLVIRSIKVVRENVFTPAQARAGILADAAWLNNLPYGAGLIRLTGPQALDVAGLADEIHFETRPSVVAGQLLFAPGDTLDPWRLYETERNLRTLPFISDARVESTVVPGTNRADVTVFTRDGWTTDPELNFELLGHGQFAVAGGVVENNLLGLGQSLELLRAIDPYRTMNIASLDEPTLFNSHWHLQGNYSADSDGHLASLLLERPFYSFETRNAASMMLVSTADRERIFSLNQTPFDHAQYVLSLAAAHALTTSEEVVRRIGIRFAQWYDSFHIVPATRAALLGLDNYRTSALMVDYLDWHPDFVVARFLDQLGRAEDRDLGTQFSFHAGYSPTWLGATTNAGLVAGALISGLQFNPGGYLWYGVQGASMMQASSAARETYASAEAVACQLLPSHPEQTLAVDGRFDCKKNVYPGYQLLAGDADGMLRGYPINYFFGTRRLLLHLEDRIFLLEDLFHLLSLGAVGFVDAGDLWGIAHSPASSGPVASVGVGLRLVSTRANYQIPVRLDFAIPLVHRPGVYPVDVSAATGQAFEPFVDPFNSAGSNVTLDPYQMYQTPYLTTDPFNAQADTTCWGCQNLRPF